MPVYLSSPFCLRFHWATQNQGRGRGARPSLFFDQNEARRAENIFLGDRSPPPNLRVWMTAPLPYLRVWMTAPLLSQGLDDRPPLISGSGWPPPLPYLRVWMTAPPLISESGWPPPPLISGSGWPPPPLPYLKVWIRHWLKRKTLLKRWKVISIPYFT